MNGENEIIQALKKVKENMDSLPHDIERDVEDYIIRPILNALGWDCSNPRLVIFQYKISNNWRVDFALLKNGQPEVIIEAKSLNTKLDSDLHEQTVKYSFASSAKIAILTNGQTWYFYLTKEDVHWKDRKFLKFNI